MTHADLVTRAAWRFSVAVRLYRRSYDLGMGSPAVRIRMFDVMLARWGTLESLTRDSLDYAVNRKG